MHLDNRNSPSWKRREFSDLCPSQSHHTRSPTSNRLQPVESPSKNGNNRRLLLSPKHSFNDRYSIDQRRERELYRDSNEYTARRESFSYQDSSDNRGHSVRSLSPNRSFNDRYSVEQRRERDLYRDSNEYTARRKSFSYRESSDSRDHSIRGLNDNQDMIQRSPSSDNRRGIDKPIARSSDFRSQQDQYEGDRCRSDHYARSHHQDDHARYRERSSNYSSRSIPNNGDVLECDKGIDGFQNDRRMNIDDTHHNNDRRFDDYSRRNQMESSLYASRDHEHVHNRMTRGFNERDIERDIHHDRFDNEHNQAFPSHSDDNEFYRDGDRSSSRRRRDSGGRREKRRTQKFDGSDEYSRRLDSYNHPQGRNYSNEDLGRDRYNR